MTAESTNFLRWIGVGLLSLVFGIIGAFFSRRLPARGWAGVLLLIVAASFWIEIDNSNIYEDPSNEWYLGAFMALAPIACYYSFRIRRHAPDRLVALAAFAGSFLILTVLLFMIAGLLMALALVFGLITG